MPSQTHNIRQRRLMQEDSGHRNRLQNRKKNSKSSQNQNGLFVSFICLIICVTILIIFFGVYTDSFHPIIDGIAGKLGYHEKLYAVVMDAGSTGTRVLAFEFHKGYLDGRLVLDKELFEQSKPGISSFADNPLKCQEQINKLLAKAKNVIPADVWSTTPLVLKATAGLRILGSDRSEGILNAVREVFKSSGFLINDKSVEIMDGTDEGIFSWFTINFLLGTLNGRNTIAALDLGGGSTQVTFAPKDLSQTPLYTDYVHTVPTLTSSVNVFTNSYLGLGLMAVRHSVFTHGLSKEITNIQSDCVNPIVQNKLWSYGGIDYIVSGKDNKKSTDENPVVDFDVCLSSVKQQVISLVKPKPITLKQHQISAFSYYFDRATETGLVDPFDGGEITVQHFNDQARVSCATANTDQPFMCLDLTFISVLLEDGFGLKPSTPLKLYKKIDGHEISWALGCAYNILTNNIGSNL